MSQTFVDIDMAAKMIGHGWTIEQVIRKIQEGELIAYARIHCCPLDHFTSEDSNDEVEKYEIARITNLKVKPNCHSEHTEWFFIHYEPISPESDDLGIDQTHDTYCDQRVSNHLKTKPTFKDFISTEQICLLNTDIMLFASGGHVFGKKPAQLLAETRHNIEGRDRYVSEIMKAISEKAKSNKDVNIFINHHRFIRDANVPPELKKSVATQVKLRISSDFNHFYKPLSRAPKKKEEDYFLPQ